MRFKIVATLCLFLTSLIPPSVAQTVDQAQGATDYSTSNIHLYIPVRSKSAAGFQYGIEINSHIVMTPFRNGSNTWYGSTNVGESTGLELAIQPESVNFGSHCILYGNANVGSPAGVLHPLPSTFQWQVPGLVIPKCGATTPPTGLMTTDGSGITVNTNLTPWVAMDKSGNTYTLTAPGESFGITFTAMDPNNNTITGPIPSIPGKFIDTFGSADGSLGALTSAWNQGPGGTQGEKFSYIDGSGLTQHVAVNYQQFSMGTNFGCVNTPDAPLGWWTLFLPTSVALPDSTSYSFAYEHFSSGGQTYYTGRLSKITYPDGGTVQYAYSGTNGEGGNGGIECNTGIVPTLTITTTEPVSGTVAVRYINNSWVAGTPNLTVTETNNIDNGKIVTSYSGQNPNIVQTSGSAWPFAGLFRTQSVVYQGSTILSTETLCYNGVLTGCVNPSVTPAYPITKTNTYHSFGGSQSTRVRNVFSTDGYGNLLETDLYDFGASSPTRKTFIAYGVSPTTVGAHTCLPFLSPIHYSPCDIYSTDGSGTLISETQSYNQDGTGYPQLIDTYTDPQNYVSEAIGYTSQGRVGSIQVEEFAIGGTTYSTSYTDAGQCNGMVPTRTSNSFNSLTTATQWDCVGGVPTYQKGVGGSSDVTTFTYADPFYRPTKITDPNSHDVNFSYSSGPSNTSVTTSTSFNNGTLSSSVYADGFGRPIISQIANGSTYDTSLTQYDGLGRVKFTSEPFSTSSTGYSAWGGSTIGSSFTYDAMGRNLTTTDANNGVFTNSVSQTSAGLWVTGLLSPTPSGDQSSNAKGSSKLLNGLGQLLTQCDYTVSSTTNCGPSGPISAGYTTSYAYNPVGTVASVTRGSQVRSFTYDLLGRVLSETTPETGTTSYTYDMIRSTTTCTGYAFPDALVQKKDANGKVTCPHYDGLGRPILFTYGQDANTDTVAFSYDTATNGGGLLAQAWTCLGSSNPLTCPQTNARTMETFAYDTRGNPITYTQLDPIINPAEEVDGTYDEVNRLSSVTYLPDGHVNNITPFWAATGYDAEGRITTIAKKSDGTGPMQTGATYGPFGPLTVSFADGSSESILYDNVGHVASKTINTVAGSNSAWETLTPTWNANGTLQKNVITSKAGANLPAFTLNYNYNDLGQLWKASDSLSTHLLSQQFGYDQYENIQTVTAVNSSGAPIPNMFQLGASSTNNRLLGGTCSPNNQGPCYDSAGRMTLTPSNVALTWDVNGQLVNDGNTIVRDAFGQMTQNTRGNGQSKMYMLGLPPYDTGGGFGGWINVPVTGGYYHPDDGAIHADLQGNSILKSSSYGDGEDFSSLYSPFGIQYDRDDNHYHQGDGFNGDAGNQLDSLFWQTPARQLDQSSARWISPDPARTGWNLYAYADNNPVMESDPSGLGDCPPSQDCVNTAAATEGQPPDLSNLVPDTTNWQPGDTICGPYGCAVNRYDKGSGSGIWDTYSANNFSWGSSPHITGGSSPHITGFARYFTAYQIGMNAPLCSGGGLCRLSAADVEAAGAVADGWAAGFSWGVFSLSAANGITTLNLPRPPGVTEGIYEFPSASGKIYVGESKNIPTRLGQHLRTGKLLPEDLSSVKMTEVLGGKTAREIAEHLRIIQLGGVDNLENIRYPIGPARRYLLLEPPLPLP